MSGIGRTLTDRLDHIQEKLASSVFLELEKEVMRKKRIERHIRFIKWLLADETKLPWTVRGIIAWPYIIMWSLHPGYRKAFPKH
jgi:hypothetical protein